MNIKIISDGTTLGTQIFYKKGKKLTPIEGVVKLEVVADARNKHGLVSAKMEFAAVELDLVASVKPSK